MQQGEAVNAQKYLRSEVSDGQVLVSDVTSFSEWRVIVVACWTDIELWVGTYINVHHTTQCASLG